MEGNALQGIALIIVLGIGVQWISWRFRLPSILLLLLAGILVGPLTNLLNPDHLLGDILFPVVSISVAIILFEGGMSLKIQELVRVGTVVRNLVSIGILVTWILVTFLAWTVLGMSFRLSLLLGAILTVTGPTVVVPLLMQIKPKGNTAAILKWEGIVNDPIGAVLAVLVFEAVRVGSIHLAPAVILVGEIGRAHV